MFATSNNLNPSSTAMTDSEASPGSAAGQRNANADFNTFLTLLTTQMRNQDPLKPMDSTAFVAQLASFSAVEQQIQTNTRLQQLLDNSARAEGLGLANLIGKSVRHSGDTMFDGTPKSLEFTPVSGADTAFLVVRNATNAVVDRRAIPAATPNLVWDGATTGGTLTSGVYHFEVESRAAGSVIANSPVESFDLVQQINSDTAAPSLILASGSTVSLADISAVR